jgi:outer membrane immunogenic protein
MKRSITLGFALFALAAAPAFAAELPVKAPPMPPVIAPAYNWSGCYIGGNVGAGWARISQSQVAKVTGAPIVPPNNFGDGEDTGIVGGGQIGCDYQFASTWVVGVQGMFNWTDLESTHTIPVFPTFNATDRMKGAFTATARLGYLFTPSVLGYVKGGVAFTRVENAFNGTVPFAFLSESASYNRTGWTVGGGIEWMFAKGWSVFGEYNYLDFGTRDVRYVQAPGTGGVADVVSTKLTSQQALVGINYKFNWGGPVVARY